MDEHHPAKSIMPQALWGLLAILALSIAVIFLWSPWDDSDEGAGAGEGGSDVPATQTIPQATPPLAGTPNP